MDLNEMDQATENKKRKPEPSPDAGYYDGHLKAFGSDVRGNIDMGRKYEFKPDRNPPVGAYDTDRAKEQTSSRSPTALIREPVSPHRRPVE